MPASGTDTSIVFMGSGPVAAASLAFLCEHFAVESVITKSKPPHHSATAPVEDIARSRKLPIQFANSKQELDDLLTTKVFQSALAVVVDYGVIVSKMAIESFPLGIVNSHFSLLPQWRGADPITFAILSGQPKTGVSLMCIEPTLDTGKIIVQRQLSIKPTDTTPVLTERLIELSNQLLLEYLPKYASGLIKPRQQSHPDRATYSRKLTKQDGIIDWQKPAEQLEREIRAFNGWPSSRTVLLNKDVIITQAHVVPSTHSKPGDIEVIKDLGILLVSCGSGSLCIDRLKPAGKRDMSTKEFIAGYYSNR